MPFVVTVAAALFFSLYMLLDPASWLITLMQLTNMSLEFKTFLLLLALGGFTVAWIAEKHMSIWVARLLGKTCVTGWPRFQKREKLYKVIIEDMRI